MGPEESVSQELNPVIDTGEESFSVDAISDSGSNAPAEVEEEVTTTSEEVGEVKEDDPVGVQKRIGKLTRKFRDQERATEAEAQKRVAVEKKAEALESEIEALRLKADAVSDLKKPSIEDFDDDIEFYEALSDYKVEARFEKERLQNQKVAEERAVRELEHAEVERKTRLQTAYQQTLEKHDDFNEVIEGIQIPNSAVTAFESLDNAGDVAYELGKNPAKAAELANLEPALAGIKLYEISQQIKSRKVTNAPAPITPLSTGGGHIKSLDSMSMAEYNAYRDKQEKAGRR